MQKMTLGKVRKSARVPSSCVFMWRGRLSKSSVQRKESKGLFGPNTPVYR